MKRIFEKIKPIELIGYSYSFVFSHALTSLRLIFVYLLIYIFGGLFLAELLGSESQAFSWAETILSNVVLGWALFTIARVVYFEETLKTIDVTQIFTAERLKACFKTIVTFVFVTCLMKLASDFLFQIFDKPNHVKEHFWSVLLLGYLSVMLFLSAFIAVAPAVRARSYTFFYMIFHPTFLFKTAIFWLFTFAPLYFALYGHAYWDYYQTGNDLILSHLQSKENFLDFALIGVVRIIAFILFSIAMVQTTTHYIVPESAFVMRKFKNKEDGETQIQAITHQPHRDEQGNIIEETNDKGDNQVEDVEKQDQEIILPDPKE